MATLTLTEEKILEELQTKDNMKIIWCMGTGRIRGAKTASGKRRYDATTKLLKKGLVTLVDKRDNTFTSSYTIKRNEPKEEAKTSENNENKKLNLNPDYKEFLEAYGIDVDTAYLNYDGTINCGEHGDWRFGTRMENNVSVGYIAYQRKETTTTKWTLNNGKLELQQRENHFPSEKESIVNTSFILRTILSPNKSLDFKRDFLAKLIESICYSNYSLIAMDTHRQIENDGFCEVQHEVQFEIHKDISGLNIQETIDSKKNSSLYITTESGDSILEEDCPKGNPQYAQATDVKYNFNDDFSISTIIKNLLDFINNEKIDIFKSNIDFVGFISKSEDAVENTIETSTLEQVKRLDLEYLANLLKNQEDDDRAEEILEEYAKKFMVDSGDLQEVLATEWNCCMCSTCGIYFGEDEFSDNDEDCCYCYQEEM